MARAPSKSLRRSAEAAERLRSRRASAADALAVVQRKRLDAEAARARAAREVRKAELAYERAEPRYRGARKRDLLRAQGEEKSKRASVRRAERKLEAREVELRALVKKLARPTAEERREREKREAASRKKIEEARARQAAATSARTRAIAEERLRQLETAEGKKQEEAKQRFLRARKGEDRAYAEMAWNWMKVTLPELVRELRSQGFTAAARTKLYRESAIASGQLGVAYPEEGVLTAVDMALRSIGDQGWFQELFFAGRVTTEGKNKTDSPGETSRMAPNGKIRQRYHTHYYGAMSATGEPNGHSYMLSTVERMIRQIEESTKNKVIQVDVIMKYVASGKRPERPERKRR